MPDQGVKNLDSLLQHPEVQQATSNVNTELRERRAFTPPVCSAFAAPCTRLVASTDYQFDIDQDARRQLPGIIHNQVQFVQACESADDDFGQQSRSHHG